MISDHGLERLKADEGLRLNMYICPAGKPTIGYGHNLDLPISEGAAQHILRDDIALIEKELMQLPWFLQLNIARRDVIINMAFNIGVPRLKKFVKMIAAIERKDWGSAAEELLDSRYAHQVGDRAKRLAEQLFQGILL